jgi:hypothetical protein
MNEQQAECLVELASKALRTWLEGPASSRAVRGCTRGRRRRQSSMSRLCLPPGGPGPAENRPPAAPAHKLRSHVGCESAEADRGDHLLDGTVEDGKGRLEDILRVSQMSVIVVI